MLANLPLNESSVINPEMMSKINEQLRDTPPRKSDINRIDPIKLMEEAERRRSDLEQMERRDLEILKMLKE